MTGSSIFRIRQSTKALLRSRVSETPAVVLVRQGSKWLQQGARHFTTGFTTPAITPVSSGLAPCFVDPVSSDRCDALDRLLKGVQPDAGERVSGASEV
jgi:hypothetical protein